MVPFVIWTVALAIAITWIFNSTRGSLLPAKLLHASINTAPYVILAKLVPSLARFGLTWILVWVLVAGLIIAATRGRLSYERYLRETVAAAPGADREPGIEKASASL